MTELRVALVGNPNSGKTTLFNQLTSGKQATGNWSGVTVELAQGYWLCPSQKIQLIDCPGVYSLLHDGGRSSIDAEVTLNFLANESVDAVINVVDARVLERSLYLTLQLREANLPMVVLLENSKDCRPDLLAEKLDCPVLCWDNHHQDKELLQALLLHQAKKLPSTSQLFAWPDALSQTLQDLRKLIKAPIPWSSMLWGLEGDVRALAKWPAEAVTFWQSREPVLSQQLAAPLDVVLAGCRFDQAHTLAKMTLTSDVSQTTTWSKRIDSVVLHRWLGLPVFFLLMYLLFFCTIAVGGLLEGAVTHIAETLLVQTWGQWLQSVSAPGWLVALLAQGVGVGVVTMLGFIPVVGIMFAGLALLEQSGYMTRAAFVVDRMMQSLNLPGQAVIPLILGFGCNVPAVMATRALPSEGARMVTILMSPFMSCSARLTVYAVFAATFFPKTGHLVIFMLYLLGMACAILTAWLLQMKGLACEHNVLLQELTAYQWPQWRWLWRQSMQRLLQFLWRAGKLVIPASMLLALVSYLLLQHGGLSPLPNFVMAMFSPMGIEIHNWPAVMALFTGMLAKEVVIGTLNTLYSSQVGEVILQGSNTLMSVSWDAWQSLLDGVMHLPGYLLLPWQHTDVFSQASYGITNGLNQGFTTTSSAVSYVIFIALYMPCVSTMAVIARELNYTWMWISLAWSLLLAYTIAVAYWQLATFGSHPWHALVWVSALSCTVILFWLAMERVFLRRPLIGTVIGVG